jgi:antitoxin component of MazEF toxin-antitoxin module
MPEAAPVTFTTSLSSAGNNTGIEVPADVLAALGNGKRPAVSVTLNGYEFRTTIGSMGGKPMVSVSAAIRKETGLQGGDPITVTLALADGPRTIDVPADFRQALDANPAAGKFFGGLSNSLQRYHIDTINGSKTEETRTRRIAKAIDLFRAGKQR